MGIILVLSLSFLLWYHYPLSRRYYLCSVHASGYHAADPDKMALLVIPSFLAEPALAYTPGATGCEVAGDQLDAIFPSTFSINDIPSVEDSDIIDILRGENDFDTVCAPSNKNEKV